MSVYPISLQGAFDRVVRHFVYNEMPPSISDKKCFYRLFDPNYGMLKCPIGVLIPDSLYREEMEGTCAEELAAEFPAIARRFQEIPTGHLAELQHLHDRVWEGDGPLRIAMSLVAYAEDCGLRVSARLRAAAGSVALQEG